MHITEAISFTNTPTFNIDALQRRVSPLSIHVIPYVHICTDNKLLTIH